MADGGFVVELVMQDLHGHATFQRQVGRLVDLGEAAPSDRAFDAVSTAEHLLHAPEA
jgi:hypothetical protein